MDVQGLTILSNWVHWTIDYRPSIQDIPFSYLLQSLLTHNLGEEDRDESKRGVNAGSNGNKVRGLFSRIRVH